MAYIDRITDQSGGVITRAQPKLSPFDGHAIKLIDPSRGIRNPAMLPGDPVDPDQPPLRLRRPGRTRRLPPSTASAPATGPTRRQTANPRRIRTGSPSSGCRRSRQAASYRSHRSTSSRRTPPTGNTHWPSATNCDRRSAPPHRWKPPTPNPSPDDACTSRRSVCASWTPTADRCAICSLGHPQPLDAAHITPTATSVVYRKSATASLCKIHHSAFDSNIVGIRPDYVVQVSLTRLRRSTGRCCGWAGLPRTETRGSAAPAGRQARCRATAERFAEFQRAGDGRKCD